MRNERSDDRFFVRYEGQPYRSVNKDMDEIQKQYIKTRDPLCPSQSRVAVHTEISKRLRNMDPTNPTADKLTKLLVRVEQIERFNRSKSYIYNFCNFQYLYIHASFEK